MATSAQRSLVSALRQSVAVVRARVTWLMPLRCALLTAFFVL